VWEVHNRTPFAVDRCWVRDRDGAEVWLVAVRCTFELRPDGTTIPCEEQQPVVQAPKHFGKPTETSLQYDTDFVLTKPTTDVLLHGSAHAPRRKPVTALDVSLRVGEVHKVLHVTGDRPYDKSLMGASASEFAQPFVQMPLTYERTYGGAEPTPPDKEHPRFEPRNPIGAGYAPAAGKLAPNVHYAGLGQGKRPAGFGPIPAHWQPRSTYAGTYDAAWEKERSPLYPRDLDDRFFLCSPEDQRPGTFLKGGEAVELINLTPSGRVVFALPRLAFGFETTFKGGERVQHQGSLYTVILEPDAARVVLVWRTSLPCHPKVQSLLGTLVWQKEIRGA
jgi:hypothetical protein